MGNSRSIDKDGEKLYLHYRLIEYFKKKKSVTIDHKVVDITPSKSFDQEYAE